MVIMENSGETLGLFRLHPRPGRPYNPLDYDADIVAVHGLGGKAYKTWTDHDGHLWLRDSLPAHVPRTRIMTFGYDSAFLFSGSKGRIGDFATDLARRLELVRALPEERERPLIFVCHSLGGVVFKELLVHLALRREGRDGSDPLLTSISAAAFLGTPHRGSRIASSAKLLSKIANAMSLGTATRSELINMLEVSSSELDDISRHSKELLKPLMIVSLYEMESMGFSRIVEPFSAILDIPNERALPVSGNHRDIARVSPRKPQRYFPVWTSIKELVEGSIHRFGSSMSLNNQNQALLQALFCHDFGSAHMVSREPQRGTCQWIFEDPEYANWFRPRRPSMLLLTGKAGWGKSVLTRHVADQLLSGAVVGGGDDASTYVGASLFCSNIESGKGNADIVLRSLLLELLRINPAAGAVVRNRLERRDARGRSSIRLDDKSLEEALLDVLSMRTMSRIFFVIDAVEELGAAAAVLVLSALWRIAATLRRGQSGSCLKVFVSSREMDASYSRMARSGLRILHLTKPRMQEEINIYLQASINDLAEQNGGFREVLETRDMLGKITERITEAADGMFLAAVLAWEGFRRGLLWNRDIVEQKLERVASVGSGMTSFYDKIMDQIAPELMDDALAIISIIAAAHRPLNEDELGTILGMSRSTNPISWASDIQPFADLGETVETHFPDLLAIRADNTVTFIHLSFKEYLIDNPRFSELLLSGRRSITRACLQYMKLKDLSPGRGGYAVTVAALPLLQYARSFAFTHLQPFPLDEDSLWLLYAETAGANLLTIRKIAGWIATPLQRILEEGLADEAVVLTLIRRFSEHGYDMDELWLGPEGCGGPLQRCCSSPHGERAALLLLELGTNPSLPENPYKTNIVWASESKRLELYKMLLAHPLIDINQHMRYNRRTLLHQLTERACLDSKSDVMVMVSDLIKRADLNVNRQDCQGQTALHLATALGDPDVVRLLLSTPGISLDVADKQGRTALTVATYWGRAQAALALIESSTALPVPAEGRLSPIVVAAMSSNKELTLKLLESFGLKGLDTHVEMSGKGILHHAAINDWADVLHTCLASGTASHADPDAPVKPFSPDRIDHSGRTAVHYAASLGNIASCQTLLDHGASLTLQDRLGRTAAQAAADAGFKDVVMLLLHSGRVDPAQRDIEGRDIAHWAATIDSVEVMQAIAELPGARLDRPDKHGKRPIDVAYQCKCRCVGLFLASRNPELNVYGWEYMYRSRTVTEEELEEEERLDAQPSVFTDSYSTGPGHVRHVDKESWLSEYDSIHRTWPEESWAIVVHPRAKELKEQERREALYKRHVIGCYCKA